VTRIYTDEAELYDIAFGWDLSAEADWLAGRLGPDCRRVLEPGCGSGRMLEALAERGLEIVGIDLSEQMVAYAQARLGGAGEVIRADMTDFDLGRRFGGAVSPVSTVGVLSAAGFESHLEVMARHLEPGARYLVQQGIDAERWRSEWEAEREGVKLHVVWEAVERGRSRSRVEVVAGPRAGEVVDDMHTSTYWTADGWRDAIGASPFVQAGCFDGGQPDRPPVELERGGGLLWHELVAP
jgi:cyclopropane fatty-acyl-phospholipid synthase-like methyltransferase